MLFLLEYFQNCLIYGQKTDFLGTRPFFLPHKSAPVRPSERFLDPPCPQAPPPINCVHDEINKLVFI